MNRWLTCILLVLLASFTASGCEDKKADSSSEENAGNEENAGDEEHAGEAHAEDKSSGNDESDKTDRKVRRERKAAAKEAMASFATTYEKMIVGKDMAGIDGLWASADDLAGCVRTEMGSVNGQMGQVETDKTWVDEVTMQRENAASELERIAGLQHTETFEHRAPVWANTSVNRAFGGEGCAVEFHGEVWFDALLEGHPKGWTGLKHRAHFVLVGDQWKLLDLHSPRKFICDNPGDAGSSVCKKVRGEKVGD